MFTGIVESMGVLRNCVVEGAARRLEIECAVVAPGTKVGDSIAINGCCLTVIEAVGDVLTFQAGPETLARTNLGDLRIGEPVNLERALAVGARLGGHFVQGHIDGTAVILRREPQGEWETVWFDLEAELASQIVPKGSVAVDGVSLTVVEAQPHAFSVALIPHTLRVTTLGRRAPGDRVNLETDILGKYVRSLLAGESQQSGATKTAPNRAK